MVTLPPFFLLMLMELFFAGLMIPLWLRSEFATIAHDPFRLGRHEQRRRTFPLMVVAQAVTTNLICCCLYFLYLAVVVGVNEFGFGFTVDHFGLVRTLLLILLPGLATAAVRVWVGPMCDVFGRTWGDYFPDCPTGDEWAAIQRHREGWRFRLVATISGYSPRKLFMS
jgi:hypothetical protein